MLGVDKTLNFYDLFLALKFHFHSLRCETLHIHVSKKASISEVKFLHAIDTQIYVSVARFSTQKLFSDFFSVNAVYMPFL